MIRVNHVRMPAGLSVLAWRDARGDVTLLVSDVLDPASQRAAARLALATSRPGWRAALLPLPVAGMLAVGRSWLRRVARVLREHAVVAATVATVAATTAALVIAAVAHRQGPAGAALYPEPGQVQVPPLGQQASRHASPGPGGQGPPAARSQRPGAPGSSLAGTSPASSSAPGHRPSPGPSPRPDPSPQPGPSPAPSPSTSSGPGPTPSPSSPRPSPKPSPRPSPSPTQPPGHGHCIWLLGIVVCL